jgi:hypothetical protein
MQDRCQLADYCVFLQIVHAILGYIVGELGPSQNILQPHFYDVMVGDTICDPKEPLAGLLSPQSGSPPVLQLVERKFPVATANHEHSMFAQREHGLCTFAGCFTLVCRCYRCQ